MSAIGQVGSPASQHPPTFIDLFAGCGGLSLGLFQAGWTGLFAIERDRYAFQSLHHNLISGNGNFTYSWPEWVPQTPHDIESFLNAYEEPLQDLQGRVTLLVGGPPCQGFSLAGRRNPFDPRNRAFLHFVKAAQLLKPPFLLLENVAGINIRFMQGSSTVHKTPITFGSQIAEEFDKLGYSVFVDVLGAAQYGVPQLRHRYFMVGVAKELLNSHAPNSHCIDPFLLLENLREAFLVSKGIPTSRPVTTQQAISDLESRGRNLVDCEDSPRFSQISYSGPTTQYQEMLHGDMGENPPNSLRLARHRPETVLRFVSLLRTCRRGVSLSETERHMHGINKASLTILDPDKASHTLTSLPDDILHYSEPRILTVREYARIQSFPDWFAFQGNYTTGGHRRQLECPRYTQVANAVPPLLAEALGLSLINYMDQVLNLDLSAERTTR